MSLSTGGWPGGSSIPGRPWNGAFSAVPLLFSSVASGHSPTLAMMFPSNVKTHTGVPWMNIWLKAEAARAAG